MQAAESSQHAPDHLQSQTVELRKLIEEQRVYCPVRRTKNHMHVSDNSEFLHNSNKPSLIRDLIKVSSFNQTGCSNSNSIVIITNHKKPQDVIS